MASFGWLTPNPFIDNDPNNHSFSSQFHTFKPLPLPDDIFGFENPMKPNNVDDLDLSKLNSNGGDPDQNFDDILFDLGISEHPDKQSQINESGVDPIKLTTTTVEKRGHKRKISGSGIFGYIGSGNDTQLAIPGMEMPIPVNFHEKKPIYMGLDNQLNQFDYNTSQNAPLIKPDDLVINTATTKSEYFVSNSSFKFPASRDTSIQHQESQLRTPVKTVGSLDDLSKELSNFANKSEAKPLQFVSPSKSPLRSIFTSSPLKPKNLTSNIIGIPGNSSLEDDRDKTISEFTTPLKVKSSFMECKTPTPNKTPSKISWFPTLITKKDNITEKMLKEQRVSPVRKKKPTITSTLARGTLDKYFIGPIDEKFICKYRNSQSGIICDREFNRISNVRAHVQTHLCDRPFVCDVCKKAFVRNHDLRRHAKVHEDFKFVCPCGKKFPRHDAMKRHRIRNICKGGYENGEEDDDNAKDINNDNVFKKQKISPQEKINIVKQPDMKQKQLELHQMRLLQLQEEQKMLESQIQKEQQQLQYVALNNKILNQQQQKEQYPMYDQQMELFDIDQNFSFNLDPPNLPI